MATCTPRGFLRDREDDIGIHNTTVIYNILLSWIPLSSEFE
jgi:hypothetical protein